MRTLLIGTAVVALSLLGAAPAAIELPAWLPGPLEAPAAPEASALPPFPAVPEIAPTAAPEPPLDLAPLAIPDEAPSETGWPFDSPLPLPPPEKVATTAAVGGALALVGFALYSRLARGELLDHGRRDEAFQLVRARPGITLTEIAQRTGLGWGTAVYHLDRLERAGFVTSERTAGRRCYFPVGSVPKDARAPIGALQQETTRSVASFVAARPGATQGELAEALGLTASAASKQVSKLESVGLVRREREWKTVRLHPQPQLAGLLAPAPVAAATAPATALA